MTCVTLEGARSTAKTIGYADLGTRKSHANALVGGHTDVVDDGPQPTPVGGRGRMRQIRNGGEDQPHGRRETANNDLTTEVLAGLVERVTFHNEDNGFCVLRVKARGKREPITVVGHAALISAGEFIQASDEWANDRTHGVQFRARFLKTMPPTTTEGIEKYLGSGMIRGIGPAYARKLVRTFGSQVFDVIEAEPHRLREVAGIGPKRADGIATGWAEQRAIREIVILAWRLPTARRRRSTPRCARK